MADAPAASEPAHEVKIEDVGPGKKQLTITVPPEVISEKIKESVGTLAAQTVLPGFRKGAPISEFRHEPAKRGDLASIASFALIRMTDQG